MSRRNEKVIPKPGKSRGAALTITHPNAAGIDIGSAAHFVAVPPDRDDEPIREFPSFTVDLNAIADWLKACGVDTVAMESTGVYWIPLFELLESRGFTVLLVNARHVKNVSGRKSDVLDCQWLQQLMTYGLFSGAFRGRCHGVHPRPWAGKQFRPRAPQQPLPGGHLRPPRRPPPPQQLAGRARPSAGDVNSAQTQPYQSSRWQGDLDP